MSKLTRSSKTPKRRKESAGIKSGGFLETSVYRTPVKNKNDDHSFTPELTWKLNRRKKKFHHDLDLDYLKDDMELYDDDLFKIFDMRYYRAVSYVGTYQYEIPEGKENDLHVLDVPSEIYQDSVDLEWLKSPSECFDNIETNSINEYDYLSMFCDTADTLLEGETDMIDFIRDDIPLPNEKEINLKIKLLLDFKGIEKYRPGSRKFHISISVHHIPTGERVTEDMWFRYSPHSGRKSGSPIIFSIYDFKVKDLYMIVRIDEFSHGMKIPKNQKGKKDKSHKRLYLIPTYWTCFNLGSFHQNQTNDYALMDVKNSYTDEQIYEFASSGKRRSMLPDDNECYISFDMSFIPYTDSPKSIITPSYEVFGESDPVRLAHSFNSMSQHFDYSNILYLYPKSISLSKKNVYISIYLKEEWDVCKNIYSKSKISFEENIKTRLNKGTCQDEIKIQIPTSNTKSYHLYFEFYTVERKKSTLYQDLYGIAFVPVIENGRFALTDNLHIIDIYTSVGDDYMRDLSSCKLSGTTFSFQINLSSSMHSIDTGINNFFYSSKHCLEEIIEHDMMALEDTNVSELWKFFPLIVTRLLSLISSQILFDKAVRCLFILTSRSVNYTNRADVLASYPAYVQQKPTGGDSVYHSLIIAFKKLIDSEPRFINMYKNVTWFFFALVTKSLFLHSSEMKEKNLSMVDPLFFEDLKSLTTVYISKYNDTNSAIFIRNIFSIVDKEYLFLLLRDFFFARDFELVDVPQEQFKFKFLRLMVEYEQYVHLSTANPVEFEKLSNRMIESICPVQHFFASCIINCVDTNYDGSDLTRTNILRTQSIELLRFVLMYHEREHGTQVIGLRKHLSSIYFPILFTIIKVIPYNLDILSEVERKEWVACILYIVRYLPKHVFIKWLQNETPKHKKMLINVYFDILKNYPKPGGESHQIHLTIISSINTFIDGTMSNLNTGKSDPDVLFKIFKIYSYLFNHKSATYAFSSLVKLLDSCPRSIFYPSNFSAFEFLLEKLVELLHSSDNNIYASTVLFKLCYNCFESERDLSVFSSKMTISIAKYLITFSPGQETLQSVLSTWRRLSKMQYGKKFQIAVSTFTGNLKDLLFKWRETKEQSMDTEVLAEIYHNISSALNNFPSLRLTWLDNLSRFHTKKTNLLEAAQCKVHSASLIIQFQRWRGKWNLPLDFDNLEYISPNVAKEDPLEGCEEVEDLSFWSLEKACERLREAIKLFREANEFELALRTYTVLDTIFEHENNYTEIISNLEEHRNTCLEMLEAQKNSSGKILPAFFRIGFYGKAFNDLDGNQYIYKRTQRYSLATMKEELQNIFGAIHGDKLEMLLKNEEVDISRLDCNRVYIQVAGVKPHYPNQSLTTIGEFDKYFNIDYFLMETKYVEGGEKVKESDLEKISKRKIIFITERAFPYMNTRLRVIDHKEIIISPIANAIDLMVLQTLNLKMEVERLPVKINSLQQVIQGSVVPMVNPGPLKVCQIFLSVKSIREKKFKIDDVQELILAMENFLYYCSLALRTCLRVIDEKHKKFQDMVEKSFNEQIHPVIRHAIDDAAYTLVEDES